MTQQCIAYSRVALTPCVSTPPPSHNSPFSFLAGRQSEASEIWLSSIIKSDIFIPPLLGTASEPAKRRGAGKTAARWQIVDTGHVACLDVYVFCDMELKTREQIKGSRTTSKRSEINGPEERDRPPLRRNSSMFGCCWQKIALLLKGWGLTGVYWVTRCSWWGGQRVAGVEGFFWFWRDGLCFTVWRGRDVKPRQEVIRKTGGWNWSW